MGFKVKNVIELHKSLKEICVIDFETTGFHAGNDRAIEVAVCVLIDNQITEKFQTLINPGISVPPNITDITGITTAMLKGAPKPEDVMIELRRFIKSRPIMAHNSSFDKRFLEAEMDMVNRTVDNPWICTLMLARRFETKIGDHKLPTLAAYHNIVAVDAHRALADVIIAAQIWKIYLARISEISGIKTPDLDLIHKVCKKSKKDVEKFLVAFGEKQNETKK